jgi:hypothetical protein
MPIERRTFLTQLGLSGAVGLLCGPLSAADDQPWKLSTFQIDVTPPVGHPLLGNSFAPSKSLLDPLEARGFVLTGPGQPLVVISIDWCEIRNDAFQRWRTVLAQAAGTTPQRVLVHTIHQHDAPYFDLTAQKLLDASGPGGKILDPDFHEDCVQRAATALKDSLANAIAVTHLGTGQAKVEQIASSRRVDENGKVSHRRYSRCADPVLQALPDGEIDPWLKTISFWNGDKPLAALSAYACHPMSYYGGGEISGDFPNMARKLRDASTPRVFQIYASGCCGDVTAGKYNDGSKGNRPLFAERLSKAMAAAWADTKKHALAGISFRNEPMVLPHSELPSMTEAALTEQLNNEKIGLGTRAQAALGLSSLKQHPDGHHIDVPMIDFGAAQLVLLPAESFVAYQLFAQQQRPDSFVMTLGFGESAPGYIPTNQAYKEGFREEHGYTWNRPGAEDIIQAALKKVLAK